jgi:hypothetical protein
MSTTPQIYFNPWDPEFRANPYPYYAPPLLLRVRQNSGENVQRTAKRIERDCMAG